MLVGVVRNDTAQWHAMVFGWLKSLWRQEFESKPHTTLTFVIGLIVTPIGTNSAWLCKSLLSLDGPLDDLTACIVDWMEANRPSLSSASFFLFSDSRLRPITDISRSRSALYGDHEEVKLFQSFLL